MSDAATGEPLLELGIALAGVVAAVEAGRPAESTPAFARAVEHVRRLEVDLAWLAEADPEAALPSLSLAAMQLARVRELMNESDAGRLADVYDPKLELLLASREVDVRAGLAAAAMREDLKLSRPQLATRLGILPEQAHALMLGRLRTGAQLAAALDAFMTRRATDYLAAVGGSASSAVSGLDARRLEIERYARR